MLAAISDCLEIKFGLNENIDSHGSRCTDSKVSYPHFLHTVETCIKEPMFFLGSLTMFLIKRLLF